MNNLERTLVIGAFLVTFIGWFAPPNLRLGIWLGYASLGALWGLYALLQSIRWQMYPALASTLLLLLLSTFDLFGDIIPFWLRVVLTILCIATWGLSTALCILLPNIDLPVPSGPHKVGTMRRIFVDTNRTNRELHVQIWYPSTPLPSSERAVYHPQPHQLGDLFSVPAFAWGHLQTTPTHAYLNAPIARTSEPHPVLFYSHGLLSYPADNTALLQELASHGYVVFAIDHDFSWDAYHLDPTPWHTPDTQASDVIDMLSQIETHVLPTQMDDQYFLWQAIQETQHHPEDRLFGFLKTNSFGHIGHSFGGTTAIAAASRNPACKATVNIDGPFPEQATHMRQAPILTISSFDPLTTPFPSLLDKLPDNYNDLKQREWERVHTLFSQSPTHDHKWIRFQHAGQLQLTDQPFVLPLLSPKGYKAKRQHRACSSHILSFLQPILQPNDKTMITPTQHPHLETVR
jgi:dienelactone hydrolase